MGRSIFFSFLVWIGLSACDKPESPQFKSLENVVVELESLSAANLHADALLYNPNKNPIIIRSAKIDIMMDDRVLAVLDKEFDIKVNGNEDFVIPLDVKIRLKDLNINSIGSALGLLGNNGKEVRYIGRIKVKAYGIPFSVKVDYTDNINLKL